MKVAVIHEWLVVEAGAERVLSEILKLYPEADLFCLLDFLPADKREFIGNRPTRTSFIQRLPGARKHYRFYLPLMPLAIEQFDLSDYDLVISSSYAVAKGVITGPNQLHIAYVHSPMRYAWDLQFQYLRESGLEHGPKSWAARWLLHKIRLWDHRTAPGVDHYIANSNFIARRIKKIYGRSATVIHPPVDTDFFTPNSIDDNENQKSEDLFLTVSRLVPYKRIDLLIEAFRLLPDKRLVIVGDGPERERLEKRTQGMKIEFAGHCTRREVRQWMRRAQAFLFAAEEDFGIVPLEAQACGVPVIAYGRGGVLETVIALDNPAGLPPTGLFFLRQEPAATAAAIAEFCRRKNDFTPAACRAQADRFATPYFRERFRAFVSQAWNEFTKNNK